MVIVYRMLDILDNYEPLLTAYLPIVDRLIERTSKHELTQTMNAQYAMDSRL
jgi:hypothetical protein